MSIEAVLACISLWGDGGTNIEHSASQAGTVLMI